jgi:hypothetical protein
VKKLRKAKRKRIPVCKWTQDADGNWFMECGGAFILNDGTPSENRMKFCCECGKKLVEIPYTEPEIIK